MLTHLPRLDDSARPSLGDLQSRTELRPIPFLTWHIVERVGLDSVLHFKSRKGLAPSLCEWVQKRQDPPPFRQPAPSFSCAKQNWGLPPGLDPWGLGRLLQSLGLSHKFGPLLQSVALTVAQGAELGNSPAITSVLYILFRAWKLFQDKGNLGLEARHKLRVQQHPDKRPHVTQVRKDEKLGVAYGRKG